MGSPGGGPGCGWWGVGGLGLAGFLGGVRGVNRPGFPGDSIRGCADRLVGGVPAVSPVDEFDGDDQYDGEGELC